MKLCYSPTSPYVRKVTVTALEKGLDAKIERVAMSASPIKPDVALTSKNPLGKVPCLITDEGRALFDSPVICAYLDSLKAPALRPTGTAQFDDMTLEALADGLLDAGILLRYEATLRPEPKRWDDWVNGQMGKMMGAIKAMDTVHAKQLTGPVTPGQIAVGCAMGWFDFRNGHIDWRKDSPKLAAFMKSFSERPSMLATKPVG